ncbi:hypothetical protein PsYK624_066580 [Phanerochaete sordida]|uniref:Uncharacterized protein n=1 Tax=Phanerochaete sordida TaxID=48140 RepID=A0A9P3G907_9APHY|nr:hypothetical protein PsYK624_066580 [Phanerochaete sordida]
MPYPVSEDEPGSDTNESEEETYKSPFVSKGVVAPARSVPKQKALERLSSAVDHSNLEPFPLPLPSTHPSALSLAYPLPLPSTRSSALPFTHPSALPFTYPSAFPLSFAFAFAFPSPSLISTSLTIRSALSTSLLLPPPALARAVFGLASVALALAPAARLVLALSSLFSPVLIRALALTISVPPAIVSIR